MTGVPYVPLLIQPESGSPLRYSAALIGQPLTVQADGTIIPGTGGSINPGGLSNVLVADASTESTAQSGTFNAPYSSLQHAIALSTTNGVVLCTPVSFAAQGALLADNAINIVGLGEPGANGFEIESLTAGSNVGLQNVTVDEASSIGGVLIAVDSEFLGNLTTTDFAQFIRCSLGTASVLTLQAVDCTFSGPAELSISGTEVSFQGCIFPGGLGVNFTGAPGTITFVDSASYWNFVATGGVTNGTIVCNDPNVPRLQRTSPQTVSPSGTAGYVTLTQDNGSPAAFSFTGLSNVLVKVGVDASDYNVGTPGYSELRMNATYSVNAGSPVLLEQSIVFAPELIGGTPSLALNIVGSTIALQGYKESSEGVAHKYTCRVYIQVEASN